MLGRGFAVRRGETFPGLGPGWIRVAVRDRATSDRFTAALSDVVS
jgi:histidinol-phosphate aminotransferase